MAPEQSMAAHNVTSSVDIYGLGAILYALCTGHAPVEAEHALDVLLKLRSADPIPPRKHNPAMSRSLQEICLRCLERRPQDRYPSAAEMCADLRRYLSGEPIVGRQLNAGQVAWRALRRFPLLSAHLVSIVTILIITTYAFLAIGRDWQYYLSYVVLLTSWALLCLVFQGAMQSSSAVTPVGLAWAAVDVCWMTVAIKLADPPRGPLLIGYPLLLVASSLLLRVRFVTFMTGISILAFLLLVSITRDERVPPHYAVLFVLGLVVTGIILGGVVNHLRKISRMPVQAPSRTDA
jgi:serine/threonine-protein kinase